MIVTFSHIVNSQRVPLTDTKGREVSLSVAAADRTSVMNSEEVKTFCTNQGNDCRVRGVV